jgi:hypothetical protein
MIKYNATCYWPPLRKKFLQSEGRVHFTPEISGMRLQNLLAYMAWHYSKSLVYWHKITLQSWRHTWLFILTWLTWVLVFGRISGIEFTWYKPWQSLQLAFELLFKPNDLFQYIKIIPPHFPAKRDPVNTPSFRAFFKEFPRGGVFVENGPFCEIIY